MADLLGNAREKGVVEQDDKVIQVTVDEPVLDPESDLAVQIPEGVSGENDNPLGVHAEPTPEEAFGQGETSATKPAGKKAQADADKRS